MATHTPGPWEWNAGRASILARKDHPHDPEGYWRDVATVEPMKAMAPRGGCDPESQANARLIRAAPDLLEALRTCERELTWCVDGMGRRGGEYERARDQAREALAKATGKDAALAAGEEAPGGQ